MLIGRRKLQSLRNITFLVVVATTCLLVVNIFTDTIPQDSVLSHEYYFFDNTSAPCEIYNGTYENRTSAKLRVIIITYNRPVSLFRLLLSLNRAFYGGDNVVIDIWIDRSKSGEVSQESVDRAKMFHFQAGKCNIHIHPKHVGIRGQWLDTWDPPRSEPEIAVMLEDDLTVSPYFYTYLKLVHGLYGDRKDVAGYTLQGSTIKHDANAIQQCCVEINPLYKVFLYPTLGTSGYSPNRIKWIQFKDWLVKFLQTNESIPLVPNHVSSKWYTTFLADGNADSMWEMEYLYYTWKNRQYTLYPNFEGHKGLVYNWFENGLHFKDIAIRNPKEAEKKLVAEWKLEYENLPHTPLHVDNSGIIEL